LPIAWLIAYERDPAFVVGETPHLDPRILQLLVGYQPGLDEAWSRFGYRELRQPLDSPQATGWLL
jgi:hypothetical protein